MANDLTKLQNMYDPEVLGPMISAQLPKAIKFTGIAPLDTTLEGQAGSTITLPAFKYIGDATVVAEGEAIDYSQLETKSKKFTVKKVAKGVKMTDEASLSGYGDPEGEAARQLRIAIASAIDNDIVDTAFTAPLEVKADINLDLIDSLENTFEDAPDAIEDQNGQSTGVLFLSYKDTAKLRKEAGINWTRASELGDKILVSGVFGEVLGWEIVRSKKIEDGKGLAVKRGAMKTYIKRDILAERDRDITRKITLLTADEHYVVALVNEALAVKVSPK